MKDTARVAGLSIIGFAIAGIVSFALEGSPSSQGLDGDNPGQMLRFLRANPHIYAQAGVALLLMAISLTIGVLAVAELFRERTDRLAAHIVTAFGLFAAVMFFVHGAMRIGSSEPVLYIAGLREEWGEAAYLAVQMAGVQGVGIAAIFALCLWAVGLSLIGFRSRVLPLALCALGVLPALRVVVGPLGILGILPDDDFIWVLTILGIFGVLLWSLLLGILVLVRSFRGGPDLSIEPATAAASA